MRAYQNAGAFPFSTNAPHHRPFSYESVLSNFNSSALRRDLLNRGGWGAGTQPGIRSYIRTEGYIRPYRFHEFSAPALFSLGNSYIFFLALKLIHKPCILFVP